jgi:hypothetical protein
MLLTCKQVAAREPAARILGKPRATAVESERKEKA